MVRNTVVRARGMKKKLKEEAESAAATAGTPSPLGATEGAVSSKSH